MILDGADGADGADGTKCTDEDATDMHVHISLTCPMDQYSL